MVYQLKKRVEFEMQLTFTRVRLFRVCCVIIHWDLLLSTTRAWRLYMMQVDI